MVIKLIVSNMACILSYPHKFCCWKRFGIQGSNCTHSFQWCWYNTDYIYLYPEHIHLCLCGGKLWILNKLFQTWLAYCLTHTCSVVGRDLVSNIATAHIASIGVGTILIASTYTQSTFIYVCVVGSCPPITNNYMLNDIDAAMVSLLTHTNSAVGRDLIPNITTAHVASNGVGTILIASTYTQSTFIYVCVMGGCPPITNNYMLNDIDAAMVCSLTHTSPIVG